MRVFMVFSMLLSLLGALLEFITSLVSRPAASQRKRFEHASSYHLSTDKNWPTCVHHHSEDPAGVAQRRPAQEEGGRVHPDLPPVAEQQPVEVVDVAVRLLALHRQTAHAATAQGHSMHARRQP